MASRIDLLASMPTPAKSCNACKASSTALYASAYMNNALHGLTMLYTVLLKIVAAANSTVQPGPLRSSRSVRWGVFRVEWWRPPNVRNGIRKLCNDHDRRPTSRRHTPWAMACRLGRPCQRIRDSGRQIRNQGGGHRLRQARGGIPIARRRNNSWSCAAQPKPKRNPIAGGPTTSSGRGVERL